MATTAAINITSDITDSVPFSINASMTMYQAGTTIDLEETTGLAQRTFSEIIIIWDFSSCCPREDAFVLLVEPWTLTISSTVRGDVRFFGGQ